MAADATEADRRRQALARIEGRSPLHDWMRCNRSELEAHFATLRQPSWASVAKVLAELGVKDARGQPPNPQTARQAWIKVRAAAPPPTSDALAAAPLDTAVIGAVKACDPEAAAPAQPAVAVAAASPAPTSMASADPLPSIRTPVNLAEGVNPPPRPRFGLARPR